MRLVYTMQQETNRNALFINATFPRGFHTESSTETSTETKMDPVLDIVTERGQQLLALPFN